MQNSSNGRTCFANGSVHNTRMKSSYQNIPVTILREGKRFVAHTPVFDISTSGKTQKEVKKRLQEAINIFLEEVEAAGTLDEVLGDLGWQKAKRAGWKPPVEVSHQIEKVLIPA